MKLLIDGGALLHKAAFAAQSGGELVSAKEALFILNACLKRILRDTGCKRYEIYLFKPGGKKNFREEIFPDYKSNRKGLKKPFYYNFYAVYLMLTDRYTVVWVEGEEEDDALVKAHVPGETIIASHDKDLMQIHGGSLYNFNERKIYKSEYPGELWIHERPSGGKTLRGMSEQWFLAQMLMGDKDDGVPPLQKYKYGPMSVYKLFEDLSFEEMVDVTKEHYKEAYGDDWNEMWNFREKLLRIGGCE